MLVVEDVFVTVLMLKDAMMSITKGRQYFIETFITLNDVQCFLKITTLKDLYRIPFFTVN